MSTISPASRPVKKYYDTLARYDGVGVVHEQAVRTAFHEVLQSAAGSKYTVVPEHIPPGKRIKYDGALLDDLRIPFGYWEAKDLDDDLEREIRKKVEKGYSLRNTLFQTPERAILYLDGRLTPHLYAYLNRTEYWLQIRWSMVA